VTQPTLLFVHLGPVLPTWLPTAVRQARLFNACDIVLIAESAALAQAPLDSSLSVRAVPLEDIGLSDRHKQFRLHSPFDRSFRDGFWTYTSERFFAVDSAMQALELGQVIHLENDVMLYCDLQAILPGLERSFAGIGATFDNDMRCVPGLVYASSAAAIASLCDFCLDVLGKVRATGQGPSLNDMVLLGAYRSRGEASIDHLPIVPPDYPGVLRSPVGHRAAEPGRYSRHFDALGHVFDAAALGQFMGGVDPRNGPGSSIGFINESCLFDPRLLRPRMVRDADGRRVPVVATGGGEHRVANLHIHSKNLAAFLSA
jgi:hypothetical protein